MRRFLHPYLFVLCLLAGGAGPAWGQSLLDAAWLAAAAPAEVHDLLERGADVAARTETGRTPLHWAAAQNPTPAVVALLLDRGADATAQDAAGETPVDLATENLALTGTAVYRRLQAARF